MDAQSGIGNELESRQIYEMPATEPVGSELHAPHLQVRREENSAESESESERPVDRGSDN